MKEAKLHITDKEMQLYIKNQLPDHQRQRVELEIQLCETCLQSFIYWNSVEELAYIPQSDQAAEHIAAMIENGQARPKRKWIQHPLAQVAVAASITFVLIGSGAMSAISSSLYGIEEASLKRQVERHQNIEQEPPVAEKQPPAENGQETAEQDEAADQENDKHSQSQRWLDKATSWLEKLQDIRFE